MNNQLNLKLIKKIHEDADDTCFSSILKAWHLDDEPFTKQDLQRKQNIFQLSNDGLTDQEISKKIGIKESTVKRHICQYKRLMFGEWLSDTEWNKISDTDIMYDRMFVTSKFMEKCGELIDRESEDTYFSLNSFYKQKKISSNIRHLNAFVLDFDFYKEENYMECAPNEFYNEILKDKLPLKPTAVVDSGRGLYVIYSFKHCSFHMEKLYKEILNHFFKQFKTFGLDKKAMLLTQVIRLPGSLNTKVLKPVEVLEFTDTNYTIQDFAKLLPYTQEETQKYKVENIKKIKDVMDKDQRDPSKRKKYFDDFIHDIKKFILIRNNKRDFIGFREELIWIVRERATWSGYTINESVGIAHQCNELFRIPLEKKEIEHNCKPSEGRQFKCALETIIDKLEITEDEQIQLKVLRKKRLKKSAYAKRKRRHVLLNLTDKKYELLERRTVVCDMRYNQGYSNKQIADFLGVDKSTITRDLAYIKLNRRKFQDSLKKHMDDLEDLRQTRIFARNTVYAVQKQLLEWLKRGYSALEFLVQEIGVAKK